MLEQTGVATASQIDAVFPSDARLERGRVAIIECFEQIPCNPCAGACPIGAIAPFAQITDLPVLNHDACNGCMQCIPKCPGLAIMAVDLSYSATHALVYLPHEFLPLPRTGDFVEATDRARAPLGMAHVQSVRNTPKMDRTPVVCICVEKAIVRQVRGFRIPLATDAIVCRCSDITQNDIHELISQGYTTIEEIKRVSRLGMGSCAGRGCVDIVLGILGRQMNMPREQLQPGTFRPLTKPVRLDAFIAEAPDE